MRSGALAVVLIVAVAAGFAVAQEALDADADGVADGIASARAVQQTEQGGPLEGVGRATLIGVGWSTTNSPVGSIDTTSGAWTAIGNSGQTRFNALARDTAETFYAVAWDGATTSWLTTVDTSTGAATVVVTLSPFLDVRGMAFSDMDTLYAIHNGASGDDLYTINTTTGAATPVGATGRSSVQGLAFSPFSGTLYAWDNSAGLLTVNTATGATTDVNPSVGGTSDIQTLIAMPDGSMFGARYSLFTIDPATGSYSIIGGGSYPDVRGADFTGPFPVDLQSFTAE